MVVEVDLAPGLPGVQLVGLPDKAIQESRERVRSALRNSGFRGPLVRVVINLAPADLLKVGTSFDLPIALALLVARGHHLLRQDPPGPSTATTATGPTQASASWCKPARIQQARQRMQEGRRQTAICGCRQQLRDRPEPSRRRHSSSGNS